MPQGEHSAILSTFIRLLFVSKTFVLSILSDHLKQVLLHVYFVVAVHEILIIIAYLCFVLFDLILQSNQQSFSYKGTGLSGLNQY